MQRHRCQQHVKAGLIYRYLQCKRKRKEKKNLFACCDSFSRPQQRLPMQNEALAATIIILMIIMIDFKHVMLQLQWIQKDELDCHRSSMILKS